MICLSNDNKKSYFYIFIYSSITVIKLQIEFYYNNYNNASNYHSGIKQYLSDDLYSDIVFGKSNSDFKKVIDNIYYNKNTEFKKANITSTGITVNNNYSYTHITTFENKTPEEGIDEALQYYNIEHPTIVKAQAILETARFTSNVCIKNKNLFGQIGRAHV